MEKMYKEYIRETAKEISEMGYTVKMKNLGKHDDLLRVVITISDGNLSQIVVACDRKPYRVLMSLSDDLQIIENTLRYFCK